MPIYEYQCKKCGHQTEIWQKFSDSPLTKCEVCNGRVKKLISQNTFHLKGTGWYVTDYNSKKSATREKKATSEKDKGSTSTETKEPTSKLGKDASSTDSKKTA
jgi:putative FmdB family regulatory protein